MSFTAAALIGKKAVKYGIKHIAKAREKKKETEQIPKTETKKEAEKDENFILPIVVLFGVLISIYAIKR